MLKNIARILVLIGVLFVGYALHKASEDHAAEQKPSRDAGFKDKAEMEAAKAVGFTDPSKWRDELRRRQAKALELKMAEDERRYEASRNPATKMALSAMTWTAGGFGAVGIVNVTIENMNDFPVKDIGISCRFSGSSGTVISTANHTIYDTVKAKSKRTFKEVSVGFINSQSARAGCDVETARRL